MTNYNENFIKKLNIYSLLDKYNIDKSNCTLAIFYALSSLDKHYRKIHSNEIDTIDLLFGDYYSFEYYDLLKNDLEKLQQLTLIMKNGYVSLLKSRKIDNFIVELVNLLFSFYGEKFSEENRVKLLKDIEHYYKNLLI